MILVIPLRTCVIVWWLRFTCCMLWCMLWWLECYDYNLRGFHQCIDWILALRVLPCHVRVGATFGIVGLPKSSSSFVSRVNPSFLLVDGICWISPSWSCSVDCGEEAMNQILYRSSIGGWTHDVRVQRCELNLRMNQQLICAIRVAQRKRGGPITHRSQDWRCDSTRDSCVLNC